MKATLDMRLIRYLNLFEKITRVTTQSCFFYNGFVIFAVKSPLVSKAIGEDGKNARHISEIIGKRVKVVSYPESIADAEKFLSDIVSPIRFNSLDVAGEELVLAANKQTKASLIGRNKVRLLELSKIMDEYFGKQLRIV